MYIEGMKIDNHVWGRNTAIITLQDADDREIREIYNMYLNGSDVTLARTAIQFNHMFPPVTIDLKTTATGRHSERDVDCTKIYYEAVTDVFNRMQ